MPLNAFRTLELCFPISKRNLFLFCSNSQTRSFVTSCYIPKCIILTWTCFVMNSFFMVVPCHCALFSYNILPSNSILFIKQYFRIKITKNFYCVLYNTRGGRIFSSVLEYSQVLHNVYMTDKLTQCVTCKVYWNANVPHHRAQQKMMQSQISYEIFIVNRY